MKLPTPKSGFTLIELLIVITIIGILSNIGLNSFTSAQKKSRDAKRKAHLRQLSDAFEAYYNDKGQYPADNGSGSLMACGANGEELCTWGSSTMENTTNSTIYMVQLPEDPSTGQTYYYQSFTNNGLKTQFQLYARLENDKDKDLNKDSDGNSLVYQISGNFNCGSSLACNYGVASSNMTANEGRTLVLE